MADSNRMIHMQFDLHRFVPNERLKLLTEAVGKKYGLCYCRELSDDEIEVWAAGDLAVENQIAKPSGEPDEDN